MANAKLLGNVGKAMMFTAIALIGLGLVKQFLPAVWGAIPGLNQF